MMSYLQNIDFAYPWAFWLLLVPLGLLVWNSWKGHFKVPYLKMSDTNGLWQNRNTYRGWIKRWLHVLRFLVLSFLVMAIARPQSTLKRENITTEGIDIVIAMDVSTSMLARDFEPNRLEAAKEVGIDFIENRPNDRIGLVVFAGESFTQCPITTDKSVVKELMAEVTDGLIEDGTAIGMGLATATNRLKESEAQSKIIILLTDGENNAGFIDPLTATEAAMQFGIRVYTIGVGTRGKAPYPFQMGNRTVYQNVEVNIDEELLKEIANKTNGAYYRATDNESLREIYQEIDRLEKTKIEVTAISRKSEEFYVFGFIALGLLMLESLMKFLIVRSIP